MDDALNSGGDRESGCRVELLGGARLTGPGVALGRLEPRTAALLAYVALETEPSRAELARLLWPKAKEATARNNLAQATARLKKAVGAGIVAGKDVLSLVGVSVDVVELELAVLRQSGIPSLAPANAKLLDGYDFEDSAELGEWLDWRRDQVARTLVRALEIEVKRLEEARDLAGAIQRAEELLGLNRLSEAAYRRLMRLNAARGDRARALAVFADCEKLFLRELRSKPSSETLELAEQLRSGGPTPSTRMAVAPTSQRFDAPPFVGRDREWAAMQRAFAERRGIIVSGEPGIGKTRLMLEFAADKGGHDAFDVRPGDAAVPFATCARLVRQLLARWRAEPARFARLELARIVPELEPLQLPQGPMDKLRISDALLDLVRHCVANGLRVLVLDDLQFADAASAEVIEHVFSRLIVEAAPLAGALLGYRRGELDAALAARLESEVERGASVSIALQGLDSEAVSKLAGRLDPAAAELVPDLGGLTAGNPLFVAELLRAVREQAPAAAPGATLVLPKRMERLLERRLDRLSPDALRLARVAAVLGSEIELELAARMLDTHPIDLAEPWAELERENVLVGSRFSHDLLAEVLLSSLPRALKTHLHARAAEHLSARAGDAARIAAHWLAAENELAAASFLVRAALRARELSALAQSAACYERAADIFERHGDIASAFSALYGVGRFVMVLDPHERSERTLARLDALARTDADRARCLSVRATVSEARVELPRAEREATAAVELARRANQPMAEAEALEALFLVHLRLGRREPAAATLAEFREVCHRLGDREAEIAALLHAGDLLLLDDRHADAIPLFLASESALVEWGQMPAARARCLSQAAASELALGRTANAERTLARAREILDLYPGSYFTESRVELCSARAELTRGRFATALQRARALGETANDWTWVSQAKCLVGEILCWLGAPELGVNELEIVIDDDRTDVALRVAAMLMVARHAKNPMIDERQRFIEQHATPLQRIELAVLPRAEPKRADLEQALATAQALGARGHVAAVQAALARACLEQREEARALELVESAWLELEREPASPPQLAEIARQRALVRERLGEAAESAWRDARRVLDAAEIPAERRASHREKNPVVADIYAHLGS